MFRLDVTDVPITAVRSTALDAPSNVQSLIGTLVEWKLSHSLACVAPLSACAAPLCLAASSPSALHNLAFQKVSVAGPLHRKELMNHAPPICMLISSRQFYFVLVITSWVINIHLVLRDISNRSFPPSPPGMKVSFCADKWPFRMYMLQRTACACCTLLATHIFSPLAGNTGWMEQQCFSINISFQIWMLGYFDEVQHFIGHI